MQLSDSQVRALGDPGFFVIDGFLAPAETAALCTAARAHARLGLMQPAGLRRGGEHGLDQRVRSDRIEWVDADQPGPFRLVLVRLEDLRLQLNQQAWLGLRGVEVQLAWYPPGAHYERHFDAFSGEGNRRLTVVLYLNEAWHAEDGGQLRVYAAQTVDLEPLGGRAVVFLAEKLEHEVLPVRADRFALSAWFS
jgi:SM-20-related protein